MIGVQELGLCKPDFVSGEGAQADPAHLNVLKWPVSFTAQEEQNHGPCFINFWCIFRCWMFGMMLFSSGIFSLSLISSPRVNNVGTEVSF